MSRHECLGLRLDELPTPSLVLDLDVFEANCASLVGTLSAEGVAWRPHVKGHKSTRLAWRMIDAGAVGVTCAKVAEAEEMVAAGVNGILIANQPSTRDAWDRVARLNRSAWVAAAADSSAHVSFAVEAGRAYDTTIPLVVEVDIGMDRAGVRSPEQAVDLAREIDRSSATFAGVMGYEGHLLTVWPLDDKTAQITEAIGTMLAAVDAVRQAGLPVDIVSCGGSGSYAITSRIAGVTEIQAGGGCLMDRFYRESCHVDLEHALFVVASVSSRPGRDRAILDAGWKALPNRIAAPYPRDHDGVVVAQVYAEHLRLERTDGSDIGLDVGERVVFVPGYSDETTVLHDEFLGMRDGVVVETIPLSARGALR